MYFIQEFTWEQSIIHALILYGGCSFVLQTSHFFCRLLVRSSIIARRRDCLHQSYQEI